MSDYNCDHCPLPVQYEPNELQYCLDVVANREFFVCASCFKALALHDPIMTLEDAEKGKQPRKVSTAEIYGVK